MKNEKVFNTVFEITCDLEEYKECLETMIIAEQASLSEEDFTRLYTIGKISAYTEVLPVLTQVIKELHSAQMQALH